MGLYIKRSCNFGFLMINSETKNKETINILIRINLYLDKKKIKNIEDKIKKKNDVLPPEININTDDKIKNRGKK